MHSRLIKMSILRTCLGISFLMSVVMLMGCGQGLSGQAVGGDDENIDVLKQQIADISDRLADLDANIEAVESDQGIDDIRDVREGIQGNSDSLANLKEIIENVEETIDVINSSVVDLASLVENVDQANASAVFGNTPGDSVVDSGEISGMMPEYDDTTLPVALVVVFDDGVDGKTWGDGRYTRCVTGEPCGHLSGPTIHGREVYVKTSGHAASDPSHHWHYAYIFLKQTGAQTWPIQYVVPSSQWMAHRYFDSDNPWGDWGDLVVTADYD